jgi:hypothetical protein
MKGEHLVIPFLYGKNNSYWHNMVNTLIKQIDAEKSKGVGSMYAIKVNSQYWLPDYYFIEDTHPRAQTFSKEKDALNEVSFLKTDPEWNNLQLEAFLIRKREFISKK